MSIAGRKVQPAKQPAVRHSCTHHLSPTFPLSPTNRVLRGVQFIGYFIIYKRFHGMYAFVFDHSDGRTGAQKVAEWTHLAPRQFSPTIS